jgi:glutamate/tyrosine decarboxylase-like PLP-dependent enzyme
MNDAKKHGSWTASRELLAKTFDHAAEYLEAVPARTPFPSRQALEGLREFDEPWPKTGANAEAVIEQLERLGAPATVTTTGGRYFGFVMGGCLPVALAANWLAGAWDQNAGGWVMSPLGAAVEDVAAKWLLEALDLPRESAVGFVTGATMANFSALAAARCALLKRAGWNFRKDGAARAPALRVLASEQQHPAVYKALAMLGIGSAEVLRIPVDAQGRILPAQLTALDARTLLLTQAGNVNSGSCDPFVEICGRARAAGAWVHVDGAFGLWARASSSKRSLAEGVQLADSWAVDAHKWLNVPYDSAMFVCRDATSVQDMFGVDAPYLERGAKREGSNFTPEISRRARGIEVWAVMKFLGRDRLEALIDRCCAHALRFAQGLECAGFEILNDVVLNQVVAARGGEDEMRRLVQRIQDGGTCWVGPTFWRGRHAMRISVSSWATTETDVEKSLAAIIAAAGEP